MRLRRNRAAVLGVIALLLAACGGGGESLPTVTDSTGAATTSPAAEAASTEPSSPDVTEPTVPDDDVIDSFDEVQPAVIQIAAQGSFRDPEVGVVTSAGSGSGFIISEDGLAVTNNHVVTGAATLEIFIGGDSSRSYNATVVGVSECNDLALIQLDSDDPLPHLEWTTSAPTVGTEVYTAGFPLGDPEFTMTRGIVAKAKASGDTQWASIDAIIEHDANIQPGNSGGPLVDADGRVDGVNYASGGVTNQSQFFAIEATLAKEVVDQLEKGDFESLGINGTTVLDTDSGLAGMWVFGTAPGSPASITGILPGDIVTQLNGLPIGTDGTMKDYCDVIRTAGDRPISVEVLRYDTQEILRGEINGTRPLELVVSLADEVEGEAGSTGNSGTAYSGSQTIIDDTGVLTVEVPTEWFDVMTTPLDDSTPLIAASTSVDAFLNGQFDVPGLFFIAVPPIPSEQIAATTAEFGPGDGGCAVDEGLFEYDDGFFVGQYHVWSECGGIDVVDVTIVANSVHGDAAAILGVQLVTDADFDALDTIMATFDLMN
jgi:serine protease Do